MIIIEYLLSTMIRINIHMTDHQTPLTMKPITNILGITAPKFERLKDLKIKLAPPPLPIINLLILQQSIPVISNHHFYYEWMQLLPSLKRCLITLEDAEMYGLPLRFIMLLNLHPQGIDHYTHLLQEPEHSLYGHGYPSIDIVQKDHKFVMTSHLTINDDVITELVDYIQETHQNRLQLDFTDFQRKIQIMKGRLATNKFEGITVQHLEDHKVPHRYIAELGLYHLSMEEWLILNSKTNSLDDLGKLGYADQNEFNDDVKDNVSEDYPILTELTEAIQVVYDFLWSSYDDHKPLKFNSLFMDLKSTVDKGKYSNEQYSVYKIKIRPLIDLRLTISMRQLIIGIMNLKVYSCLPNRFFTGLGLKAKKNF